MLQRKQEMLVRIQNNIAKQQVFHLTQFVGTLTNLNYRSTNDPSPNLSHSEVFYFCEIRLHYSHLFGILLIERTTGLSSFLVTGA